MAKSKLRFKARILRKHGYGIKTIAHKLSVSPSTVSLWCRDIILSAKQIQELERRSHDPSYGKRLEYTQTQQKNLQQKIQNLHLQGIKDIGKLSNQELFFAGVSLYWAEGFKKDNLVGFANSDPLMIKFIVRWLEICCQIPKSRLKLRLGLNEQYQDQVDTIQLFWSKRLEIPLNYFQKPFFQKVKWKKEYDNPQDYHGVLRIRVSKSTDLLRTIHGWIDGLKSQTTNKV